MKYEVKAQSNDAIVAVYDADDLFDAAELAAAEFETGINVPVPFGTGLSFENKDDYYDLYSVNSEQ